jgi:predicted metal-binding membrane protein
MDTMSTGPDLAGAAGFIGAWVVMMAAMMLPSAAPLVLLYRRGLPVHSTQTGVPPAVPFSA